MLWSFPKKNAVDVRRIYLMLSNKWLPIEKNGLNESVIINKYLEIHCERK